MPGSAPAASNIVISVSYTHLRQALVGADVTDERVACCVQCLGFFGDQAAAVDGVAFDVDGCGLHLVGLGIIGDRHFHLECAHLMET